MIYVSIMLTIKKKLMVDKQKFKRKESSGYKINKSQRKRVREKQRNYKTSRKQ